MHDALQKAGPGTSVVAGGKDQRFFEWVIRVDEELVSSVKAGQAAVVGERRELAAWSPVAGGAGEYQIPWRIKIERQSARHQRVWKEVIDVGDLGGVAFGDADRSKAVKAAALLVAVQGGSNLGDASSLAEQCWYEQLPRSVVEHDRLLAVGFGVPCFFDETPSGLGLKR